MDNVPNFASGAIRLTLTQKDLAAAVEHWLNGKIMKVPIIVTGLEKSRTASHLSETFVVVVVEKEHKGD